MSVSIRRVLPLALLGLIVVLWGCAKKEDPAQASGLRPGGPAGIMPGPGGMSSRETGKIMQKLDKMPDSPRRVIREALNADPTPWDKIQPKAAEYAQLAAELGKHEPPAGDKDAWKKNTSAFADDASALDKAAQAKDLEAAKAANTKLNNSCMGCHNEHRMKGPGGPGGKRKGGFKKGPPPA